MIKCRTKRINFRDYAVPFNADQKARTKEVFPDGVCDFSKRGVEQGPIAGTWIDFGNGS